jgi:transcriptional regulator with XRE-family HTH domain
VIRGQEMQTFDDIEEARRRHGLTRRAIYERAGINGETWRRTAAGRTSPNMRTLQKLLDATRALIDEREAVE